MAPDWMKEAQKSLLGGAEGSSGSCGGSLEKKPIACSPQAPAAADSSPVPRDKTAVVATRAFIEKGLSLLDYACIHAWYRGMGGVTKAEAAAQLSTPSMMGTQSSLGERRLGSALERRPGNEQRCRGADSLLSLRFLLCY